MGRKFHQASGSWMGVPPARAASPACTKATASPAVTVCCCPVVRSFAVTAYDEAGPIGKGTHERFIIQNDKFLAKAQGKKKGN